MLIMSDNLFHNVLLLVLFFRLKYGLKMKLKKHLIKSLLYHKIQLSARRSIQTSVPLIIRQNPREFAVGNDFSYEDVVKDFKWDVPEHFNFSTDVIDKFAKTDGYANNKS